MNYFYSAANYLDVKVCVCYLSIFHQMKAFKKLWKMVFVSPKFPSPLRYQDVIIFVISLFLAQHSKILGRN